MKNKIETYFDAMLEKKYITKKSSALHQFNQLFGSVDFQNKKVLDVGGGAGIYTFYASISGAQKVVCLEPELAGGKNTMNKKFLEIKTRLNVNNAELVKETIQSFNTSEKFDIILSMASINHLNEHACINLSKDKEAYKIYKDIFRKLFDLLNNNGLLLIMDVGRRNFWGDMGFKNPFVPAVEWHKHQSPALWTKIAFEAEFKSQKTVWTSLNRLHNLPQPINKILAYFVASHFHLYLYK